MSVPVLQEDTLGLVVRIAIVDPNRAGVPLDLTGATVTFVFVSPDEPPVRTVRTATIEGAPTLGKAVYVTQSGDMDTPGTWQVQARVNYSVSQVYFSEVGKLKVKANL